ncbi:MAG: hypothetical protein H0U69_04910 [Trueperaceae bacterium]|nr:hypothetical protein [Trueperaceae bacterium]
MSILDVVLVLTIATVAALGAQRRFTGLLVGVGGAIALRPLLILADLNPWLALVGALLVGLGLALLGRHVLQISGVPGPVAATAGGVGGAILGIAVVLTLVTSLPIGRSAFNPNELVYPPDTLPASVRPAVQRSALVAVGREVLFAPLLTGQAALPRERAVIIGALHRWIVVGEPWRTPS